MVLEIRTVHVSRRLLGIGLYIASGMLDVVHRSISFSSLRPRLRQAGVNVSP
jgi:hypothetical protein